MEALNVLFLRILLEQGEPRFRLVHIGTLRSLVVARGAEELMEQLGARGTVSVAESLQCAQLGRLGRLAVHLLQSWQLHLSGSEQPAPVLEVVAVLHQHFLFLEAVEQLRQGVKAELLYLLLQLPVGELWLASGGSEVVARWHSLVVEVVADHGILVRGLLHVGTVFPPLPLGKVAVAYAVVFQMRLLQVLLRVLLRVVARGHLRVVVAVEVALVAEVVVSHDGLQLGGGVREVRLGIEALRQDGDVVVVLGRLHLAVNGADVHFLLVDHDHHLPLALVLAHSTELRAAERVLAHVVVWPLRFLADEDGVRRALADGVHDLGLLLQELGDIHVLLDLCLQSDEC